MKKVLTKDYLIAFEEKIAEKFNNGEIHAPVHLYSGNEDQIIQVFSDISDNDWVLCSWRSHYQCLLKGVPEQEVLREIVEGRSISLCFPDHRIFSSAIVGGILSIATGIAFSIKLRGDKNKVHCFMGEMTAETGIASEAIKYCKNFSLPIRFIVEDNEKSVCTDTRAVWGSERLSYERNDDPMIVYYKYKTKYPHAGAGVRVQF
jgi:pyruvate dehydrogenase E1 component alpha subunit